MTGDELAALREALGLNQAQAAKYLGVDRATILRWERSGKLGRLAEYAAEKLVPGRQLEAWIGGLQPAARRGINRRRGRDGMTSCGSVEGELAGQRTSPGDGEQEEKSPGGHSSEEVAADEYASGAEVERLRAVLRTKFRLYRNPGIADLGQRSGVLNSKLKDFAEGRDELTTSEYAAVLEVIRETET
jgi:hypothetical protein